MKTSIVSFMELPELVDASELPNNGGGKEYASYLVIEDGEYRKVYSSAMEPEDAQFHRDLDWIKTEFDRMAELQADLSTKLKFACRALGKSLTKEEYAQLEKLISEGWAE